MAFFDLLQRGDLDKTTREQVKQASKALLATIQNRLKELDRFWEKEQTKADIEIIIMDKLFTSLPTPPFSPDEKNSLARNIYQHVWQQAVSGVFSMVA